MERAALEKHEFFDGEIFLMAGASNAHNLIVANAIHVLKTALGAKCRVYPSDMKVFIPATGSFTYPDVSVLCGTPQFYDDIDDVLCNPEVLIEVLSDSTENYDRGKKFESYRSVASFTHYVLIAQDRKQVEHYARQADGAWLLRELHGGHMMRLPCAEVAIDPLYEWVLGEGSYLTF
jgi:Uma2 family endonuclease